jgi:Glycosyltransferase family 92
MLSRMKRIVALLFFFSTLHAAPPYELSVCTMFQNEAQWLEEWIAYHQVVGVDHFYLYCQHSWDDYQEVLAPYVEQGVVDLVECKGIGCSRDVACSDCLCVSGLESKWIAFLDLDEYLVPVGVESLVEVLRGVEGAPVVAVGTLVFGTSGVRTLGEDELLIESLTRCAECCDGVKLIVQPALLEEGVEPVEVEGLQINHYWGRTEEWAFGEKLLRVRRSDPEALASWQAARALVEETLASGSVCEDLEIQRFVSETRELLQEEVGED